MKLIPLILFLILSPPLYADNLTEEEAKQLAPELGYVYKGMPKDDLPTAGYTKETMLDYRKDGDKEYLTFSDWTTPQYGDTVTFVIEDNKVVDWFKKKKSIGKKKL